MAPDPHVYSAITATDDPSRFTLVVEAELCAYGNDRYFLMGGVGSGSAVEALEIVTGRPLITASTQFLSYATLGEELTIVAEVQVEGRALTQARATSWVGDRAVVAVTGAFGERPDDEERAWFTMPDVPAPLDCPVRLPEWHEMPSLHDRIEQRLVPASDAAATGRILSWTRPLRPGPLSAGYLAVLADFLPMSTYEVFTRAHSTNSLDNVLRIHGSAASEWVLMEHQLSAIGRGLFHIEGRLFAENGTLVATAGQSGLVRYGDR
ncbi:MAG: thioesterase family protein [Actinomycetota bacterium]